MKQTNKQGRSPAKRITSHSTKTSTKRALSENELKQVAGGTKMAQRELSPRKVKIGSKAYDSLGAIDVFLK